MGKSDWLIGIVLAVGAVLLFSNLTGGKGILPGAKDSAPWRPWDREAWLRDTQQKRVVSNYGCSCGR